MPHNQNVSPNYWPTRYFNEWNVFPASQNVITDPDELAYFQEWTALANEAIINRLNMSDALMVPRPSDEYIHVSYFFADRQEDVLSLLKDMTPPQRLEEFHDTVVSAVESQVAFYQDFAQRKADNPSLTLSALLQHEKLKDCDQKLWAAYHEFERLYPKCDSATNNAIEQRLCWLDAI